MNTQPVTAVACMVIVAWVLAFMNVYSLYTYGTRKERLHETIVACPTFLLIMAGAAAGWLVASAISYLVS